MQIRNVCVSKEEFSIANNLMTATHKLKRQIAQQFFQKEIDKLYKQ
jgi:long-subunit acyl-CoA synthetase (AMP-forming)